MYFTRGHVFNRQKQEHGPSSGILKKEGKEKEGCGRWGTLATVRETTEEGT